MSSSTRFAQQTRVPLPGSERHTFVEQGNPRLAFASVGTTGGAEKHDKITVSVVLKPKSPINPQTTNGTPMTREQFAAEHGADPAAVEAVKEFAKEFGLHVEADTDPMWLTVKLTGTVEAMEKAFGTSLAATATPDGTLRTRTGAIMVPEELAPYLTAVLGLDNRPQAKPHSRIMPRAVNVSYSPQQVGQLYGFPTTGAAGQTIGIVELGGGFRPADLDTYFSGLGLKTPTVTAVSVDKAKNKPGNANGADGEVMLDIEVAGAVAQGAAIAVYFAPNTDQGFVDAITTAVHDAKNKPSVISISWGAPESSWTQQGVTAMDQAFQAAAAMGVTVTVASGDNGSTDGVTDGANHVDFPSSSPNVLACGGTKLMGTGASITSEVVWNEQATNEGATGGGVSSLFSKPSWQTKIKVPAPPNGTGGRGVPDVAGDADPLTGYKVRVDGQDTVIGGTSAVAPLWAGLIAVANAKNGKSAGFVNAALYAANQKATFRDITSGNNGAYKAAAGWDPCTGLGSPVGSGVVAAVKPK